MYSRRLESLKSHAVLQLMCMKLGRRKQSTVAIIRGGGLDRAKYWYDETRLVRLKMKREEEELIENTPCSQSLARSSLLYCTLVIYYMSDRYGSISSSQHYHYVHRLSEANYTMLWMCLDTSQTYRDLPTVSRYFSLIAIWPQHKLFTCNHSQCFVLPPKYPELRTIDCLLIPESYVVVIAVWFISIIPPGFWW